MAIILPGGFNITNNEPVDARFSVADSSARLGISSANVYEGLIVYQQDTNQLYVLTDSSDPSIEGNWTAIGQFGSYAMISGGNAFLGDQSIDGDVTISGTITAQEFHTEFVSASVIYESGSTLFGDTLDDTHLFTGSINLTGSLGVTGPFTLQGDQTSTGSYRLELDGVDKYFSVNINGVSQVKVNEEGVLQVASKDVTPTAVTGGLFYSSSNEYYLGFI